MGWLRLSTGMWPINRFDQALADPHYRAREMVQSFEHPVAGTVNTLGFLSKFSATPPSIRAAPPTFGQHTEAVLGELGLEAERIATLREAGIVA